MATTSPSAPSSDFLLDLMRKSLPEQTSETQNLLLKDSYAAIALFSHACMLAVGFRLVGLGEDHKVDAQSDSTVTLPLPSEWDASSRYSTPTYAFRYKHPQSSMEYLLKVNRLGSKAVIYGLGLGHDQTAYFDVKAQDYISEGSLKEVITTDTVSTLRNIFISPGRISDLSSLFKSSIIQKLAPGLQKAGAEDTATSDEQSRRTQETRQPEQEFGRGQNQIPRPANPYAFNDPLAAAPQRPIPVGDFPPPGFDDEYDLNRPPRGMPGGRQPFGNIGDRDLYPPGLGPHDPLRIGPGGGGYGGGGGMHPTFDDPIFGGQGERTQFNPRAPPGARYDPVGPGDGPPNLRGGPRFPGGRGGGGGGFGGNPFGGFGGNDFI